jgi:diguanylate cyclase (GGDEF)-like protein
MVLLLPHTSIDRAAAVGQRIRLEVEQSNRANFAQVEPNVTMTMGLSSLQRHKPDSPDALIRLADEALYAGKQAGKNRLVVYGEAT